MGQCCGGGDGIKISEVIRVQALVRRWLARQRLNKQRLDNIKAIASKFYRYSQA